MKSSKKAFLIAAHFNFASVEITATISYLSFDDKSPLKRSILKQKCLLNGKMNQIQRKYDLYIIKILRQEKNIIKM